MIPRPRIRPRISWCIAWYSTDLYYYSLHTTRGTQQKTPHRGMRHKIIALKVTENLHDQAQFQGFSGAWTEITDKSGFLWVISKIQGFQDFQGPYGP